MRFKSKIDYKKTQYVMQYTNFYNYMSSNANTLLCFLLNKVKMNSEDENNECPNFIRATNSYIKKSIKMGCSAQKTALAELEKLGLVSVHMVFLENIGKNRFVRLYLNKIEELLFTPNDEEPENIDQMATRIAMNLEIAPERFSMPIEDTNSMEYEGNHSAVNENTSEAKIANGKRYY